MSQVRVGLRVRPLLPKEIAENADPNTIWHPSEKQVAIGLRDGVCGGSVCSAGDAVVAGGYNEKVYTYDHVFPSHVSQASLYSATAGPMLSSFLEGYNVTIMAYGQTGSGKTYTMGSASSASVTREDQMGLIPRFLADLFSVLDGANAAANPLCSKDSKKQLLKARVQASFLEIYGEDIHDLMNVEVDSNGRRPNLDIRENKTTRDVGVAGLKQTTIDCLDDAMNVLRVGTANRTTGATNMNQVSSRSHAVFTITLEQTLRVAGAPSPVGGANDGDVASCSDDAALEGAAAVRGGGGETVTEVVSKLTFVDLAGSERLKKTGAKGTRMKEGIDINVGLFALGNVINALGDEQRLARGEKPAHVPYRSSKLTRLLQDALGGNSQTLFLACVSPADLNFNESLSTLRYADRARNIRNKPVKNVDPAAEELSRLRCLTQLMQSELCCAKFGPEAKAETASSYEDEAGGDRDRAGGTSDARELMRRDDVRAYLSSLHARARDEAGVGSIGGGAIGAGMRMSIGIGRAPIQYYPKGGPSLPTSRVAGASMLPSAVSGSLISSESMVAEAAAAAAAVEQAEERKTTEAEELALLDKLAQLELDCQESNNEIAKVDKEIDDKEDLLTKLRGTIEGYHVMRQRHEETVRAMESLEVQREGLLSELEKKEHEAVEQAKRAGKAAKASAAVPSKSALALREKLKRVETQLTNLKAEKRRTEQAVRNADREAKRARELQDSLERLKGSKAQLQRKHHEAQAKQREFERRKNRELEAARRAGRKIKKQVSSLELEVRQQKNALERRNKYVDRVTSKLQTAERHCMMLLKEKRRGALRGKKGQGQNSQQTAVVVAPDSQVMRSKRYKLLDFVSKRVRRAELETLLETERQRFQDKEEEIRSLRAMVKDFEAELASIKAAASGSDCESDRLQLVEAKQALEGAQRTLNECYCQAESTECTIQDYQSEIRTTMVTAANPQLQQRNSRKGRGESSNDAASTTEDDIDAIQQSLITDLTGPEARNTIVHLLEALQTAMFKSQAWASDAALERKEAELARSECREAVDQLKEFTVQKDAEFGEIERRHAAALLDVMNANQTEPGTPGVPRGVSTPNKPRGIVGAPSTPQQMQSPAFRRMSVLTTRCQELEEHSDVKDSKLAELHLEARVAQERVAVLEAKNAELSERALALEGPRLAAADGDTDRNAGMADTMRKLQLEWDALGIAHGSQERQDKTLAISNAVAARAAEALRAAQQDATNTRHKIGDLAERAREICEELGDPLPASLREEASAMPLLAQRSHLDTAVALLEKKRQERLVTMDQVAADMLELLRSLGIVSVGNDTLQRGEGDRLDAILGEGVTSQDIDELLRARAEGGCGSSTRRPGMLTEARIGAMQGAVQMLHSKKWDQKEVVDHLGKVVFDMVSGMEISAKDLALIMASESVMTDQPDAVRGIMPNGGFGPLVGLPVTGLADLCQAMCSGDQHAPALCSGHPTEVALRWAESALLSTKSQREWAIRCLESGVRTCYASLHAGAAPEGISPGRSAGGEDDEATKPSERAVAKWSEWEQANAHLPALSARRALALSNELETAHKSVEESYRQEYDMLEDTSRELSSLIIGEDVPQKLFRAETMKRIVALSTTQSGREDTGEKICADFWPERFDDNGRPKSPPRRRSFSSSLAIRVRSAIDEGHAAAKFQRAFSLIRGEMSKARMRIERTKRIVNVNNKIVSLRQQCEIFERTAQQGREEAMKHGDSKRFNQEAKERNRLKKQQEQLFMRLITLLNEWEEKESIPFDGENVDAGSCGGIGCGIDADIAQQIAATGQRRGSSDPMSTVQAVEDITKLKNHHLLSQVATPRLNSGTKQSHRTGEGKDAQQPPLSRHKNKNYNVIMMGTPKRGGADSERRNSDGSDGGSAKPDAQGLRIRSSSDNSISVDSTTPGSSQYVPRGKPGSKKPANAFNRILGGGRPQGGASMEWCVDKDVEDGENAEPVRPVTRSSRRKL